MIDKVFEWLKASIRDLILAGVAAASGFLIGKEIPGNTAEVKALLVGAVYVAVRAVIAAAILLLKR